MTQRWTSNSCRCLICVLFCCLFVCFYVVVVFLVMSLPKLCLWSLWCRSHSIPTSGISLRWSDLLYVMSSLSPSGSPSCLDKSYVLVTNTNLILCSSYSLMSLHCMPFSWFLKNANICKRTVWWQQLFMNIFLRKRGKKEKKNILGYRFIHLLAAET